MTRFLDISLLPLLAGTLVAICGGGTSEGIDGMPTRTITARLVAGDSLLDQISVTDPAGHVLATWWEEGRDPEPPATADQALHQEVGCPVCDDDGHHLDVWTYRRSGEPDDQLIRRHLRLVRAVIEAWRELHQEG